MNISPLVSHLRLAVLASCLVLAPFAGAQTVSGLAIDGYWKFSESSASKAPAAQISVGPGVMVLREDGTVYSSAAQIGAIDATTPRLTPGFNIPPDLPRLRHLAAGLNLSAGVLLDGTVISWGDTGTGIPQPMFLANVTRLAAGGGHIVALRADGTLAAWGDNSAGQCNVPKGLPKIKEIAALGRTSFALGEDGMVYQFGDLQGRHDYTTGSVPPSNFVHIAAGGYRLFAARADGSGAIFGAAPREFKYAPGPISGVRSIACDGVGVCVRVDGSVWTSRDGSWTRVLKIRGQAIPDHVAEVSSSPDGMYGVEAFETVPFQCWIRTDSGEVRALRSTFPTQSSSYAYPDEFYPFGSEPRGSGHLLDVSDLADGTFLTLTVGNRMVRQPTGGTYSDRTDIVQLSHPFARFGLTATGEPIDLSDGGKAIAAKGIAEIQAFRDYHAQWLSRGALMRTNTGRVKFWDYGLRSFLPISPYVDSLKGIKQMCLGLNSDLVLVPASGPVLRVSLGQDNFGEAFPLQDSAEVMKVQCAYACYFALMKDGHVRALSGTIAGIDFGPLSGITGIYGSGSTVAVRDSGFQWRFLNGSLSPNVGFQASQMGQALYELSNRYGDVYYRGKLFIGIPELTFTFSDGVIAPGSGVTGQIFLDKPAPVGGTTVALTCYDSSVTLPAWVSVPEGRRSATFRMTTSKTETQLGGIEVWATLGTTKQRASLAVAKLSKLTVDRSTVIGGSDAATIQATITLKTPAPAGGFTYAICYTNSALHGPTSVSIPAGDTSVTFAVTADMVTGFSLGNITATRNRVVDEVAVTVGPLEVLSLSTEKSLLFGGDSLHLTVKLNAPTATDLVVRIASSDPLCAPSGDVVIPAHYDSAEYNPTVSHHDLTGTGSASFYGITLMLSSVDYPAATSVTVKGAHILALGSYMAGDLCSGKVQLDFTPITNVTFALSGTEAVDGLDPTVTVTKGSVSAEFKYRLRRNGVGDYAITATAPNLLAGRLGKVATPIITNVNFQPQGSVVGGSGSLLEYVVKLDRAYTWKETLVALESSKPAILSVPMFVTIPAGATSIRVPVTHFAVPKDTFAGITATAYASSGYASIKVKKP